MLRTIWAMVVLMALVNPIPLGGASAPAEDTGEFISRPPINIGTDDDFTAENGVVGGTGTLDDPYRISGWHIIPNRDQGITNDRGIRIGSGVRDSFFLIENNFIELQEHAAKGVSIGSPVGGTVRGNTIISTAFATFGVVVSTSTGVENRQDPLTPLRIEGNELTGQLGKEQVGFGFSGTSALVNGNRFHNLDIGVIVAASLTIGHQIIRIHNNDFIDVDWAAPAALVQVNTLNIPIIDASDNYWGHPEGPTIALCTNTLGCNIAPLGEYGAKVAPNVLAYPYAEEPFYPD